MHAKLVLCCLLASCAAPAKPEPAKTAPPAPPAFDVGPLRQRIATVASCEADTDMATMFRRIWCPVTMAGTEPLVIPKWGSETLPFPGLSFGVPLEGDLDAVIREAPLFSLLLLSAERARIIRLAPENEDEARDMQTMLLHVAQLLSGDHGRVGGAMVITEELDTFLRDTLTQPGAPVTWADGSGSFRAAMESHIYSVSSDDRRNEAFITVELAENGYWVGLYPSIGLTTKKSEAAEEPEAGEPAP